ncbi:ATP-dependent (S)-NAD(P)H-hydrate dehydratase [Nucleospora cyclopteri]
MIQIDEKICLKNFKDINPIILGICANDIYTGVGKFISYAALKTGAQKVILMSPDRVSRSVLNNLNNVKVTDVEFNVKILQDITCCVVGPGLGRINNSYLDIIIKIVNYLDVKGVYTVLDADILHFYKHNYFQYNRFIILTPNCHERIGLNVINKNHIVIYKGKIDKIAYKNEFYQINHEETIKTKRCGGQGDVLTGILATTLSFNSENPVFSCIFALQEIRRATSVIFKTSKLTMVSSDILTELKSINNIKDNK